jgi:serine phosphatase RsbU (regulator of sigma subunit)/pSer/pThr/pTyr-binding forkhead associated (FHA) protein
MDRLRVVPPYGKSFVQPLSGESLVIGRSSSADLHIGDRFLSRHHARLYQDKGELWLEDLGSRNGSWINGKRVDHPMKFRSGDRIRLSNTYIVSGSETETLERTPTDFLKADSEVSFRPVHEVTSDEHPRPPTRTESKDIVKAQADHLRLLNQIHSALSKPVDLESLLEMILDRSFEALQPDQGVIYLQQPTGDYHRAAERSVGSMASEYLDSQTLLDKVAREGLTAHVLGLDTDSGWQEAGSLLDQGVKSLIAAPLTDTQGSLGMIAMTSHKPDSPFGDRELELLVSISSIASLRIRNLLLTEDAVRKSLEAEQIDRELKLARRIQLGLLPAEVPQVDGFELHGSSMPCRFVSGDYYQMVSRQDDRELVVVLADVVGKGLGASLLTASLEALAAGPIEVGRSPVEICSRVGRRLHERTITGKFATMIVVALRTDGKSLTFANAGHCPGLLVRHGGRIRRLNSTGPPLGLFPNIEYQEANHHLTPGDLLVLYSDGLTEAADCKDREYGLRRLTRVCKDHRDEPLTELARAIESDIEGFVQGQPYEDDRTLVLVRRTH